ncbi:response regulator [Nitrospira moscoviensis]|uniref:Response regulator, CheY like n=1 Tax=Nitrospira moscoviensis TaxID=42253 RepID=A0A0K2G8C7_NITMO|nr:response regulator [Nitrospira moscoviensis]ALA57190.1 Response regulator, CheY like [Nitrospira moscoviensis]
MIDDQAAIRMLLRTVLENAGYTVREAASGQMALALYREQRPDLVITDLVMPEMTGLDLILEMTREFLDAKVIAMTGEISEEGLQTAKLLGARHTFHKPFSMDKLLTAIRYELAH